MCGGEDVNKNRIDMKEEALTYYLLKYICIYENQYSQKIDYLIFTDLDNIVNEANSIFKVGLDKIYKFLSFFDDYQFSINNENEIVILCKRDEGNLNLNFKIYMISEEKSKKFPQLINDEIELNLFLHVIESFTTIKFKKNILVNEIPEEYR